MSEELPNRTEDGRLEAPQAPAKPQIAKFVDNYGDPVEIFCDNRLPDYDSGPVKAYMARGKDGGAAYFALVCEKNLVPRTNTISAYKNFDNAYLVPLVSAGVTYWPPTSQERYVFLYRQVAGKRIHKDGEKAALGWRQEAVMENIVKPIAALLKEFHDANFVHGSIRPSNIFADLSTGKPDKVMFGDCLSTPASYLQPVLFEPIERAMASPVGRGQGVLADDLYAFGVALAVILRSHDPLQGMTDYEIIGEKMEHGSYAAVTGKDRFKGSILELLRGLLHDDAKERWTIEEVMTWLDGRRLSPKQALKLKKAARPIAYEGHKHLYASHLAMDLGSNLAETARLVESGDLEQWLQRSLEDDETQERVMVAVKAARERGTGPGYEERLAANLSIALDPLAPIRYKGLNVTGEGLGAALAETTVMKQDIQRFVELFSQGIAFSWLTSSKNASLDAGSLITRFDQCRNHIRHGKPGSGFERCIYLLCPEAPCYSEKLKDYFVTTPEDMIRAFEDMCKKGKAPAMFLDRQSMAFLSAKDAKVIDPFLFDLSASEEHRKIMGNLKSLAAIQKRSNLPMFPAIAKVFVEAMGPVYERFHDRDARAKLETAVKKFGAEGDLAKMAALLASPEMAAQDYNAFRIGMREYADLDREYATLERNLENKSSFGKATGKEFAAVISSVIAGIIILATALMFISNHSLLGH